MDPKKSLPDLGNQMNALVSGLSQPVVLTNSEGTILHSNQAFSELTQFRPEDIMGLNPGTWNTGSRSRKFYRLMWETISEGNPWNGTVENYRKDRSSYHADLQIIPVKSPGEEVFYLGLHHALNTPTYDCDSKVLTSPGLSDTYLPQLCHDMRTYLTGILGSASIMASSEGGMPSGNLQRILSSSSMLHNLLNDVMDMAKFGKEQFGLSESDFSLTALIRESVDLFRDSASCQGTGLTWEISGRPGEDFFRADAYKLKRVVANLLSNALKFTPKGSVHIQADPGQQGLNGEHVICISVADTGTGIERDKQKHLFREFSQADQGVQASHGGSGLGLSVCKLFVEMMGGSISLRSEPGRGSMFWFTIPVTPVKTCDLEKEPSLVSEAELRKFRVLICDDDPVQRYLMEKACQSAGIMCEIASGALEARKLAEEKAFDCLFTDCNMPGVDGFELAGYFREHPAPGMNGMKIIGLTGYSDKQTLEKGLESGMDLCLTKPSQPGELVRIITNGLSSLLHRESDCQPGFGEEFKYHRREKLPTVCG